MPVPPAFLASLLVAASVLPAAAAAPLAAERWNKRVVVAFANGSDEASQQQLDYLLADRRGLAERDMLVIRVAGREVSAAFGALPEEISADALRAAYRVAPNAAFTVILVGKDGGEKLRKHAPVPALQIFGLIDAMPMRKSEMKRN